MQVLGAWYDGIHHIKYIFMYNFMLVDFVLTTYIYVSNKLTSNWLSNNCSSYMEKLEKTSQVAHGPK